MDPLSNTASLIILASQEGEAQDLVSSLRNGALALRCVFASNPESLEELAGTNPFSLILCCDYDPAVDLASCMAHYRKLDLDIPLIVIADKEKATPTLIEAMRTGARDLTEQGDTERLRLVVARELSDLEHRQTGQRLRQSLRECEQKRRTVESGPQKATLDRGLPNRAALMKELAVRLNRNEPRNTPFAAIYVGLNAFTKVALTSGLTAALAAVEVVGKSLRGEVPPASFLARVSDEGYVLLLDDPAPSEAVKLASRLARKARLPQISHRGTENSLDCDTGLMLAAPGTHSAADVLNGIYREFQLRMRDSEADPTPAVLGRESRSAHSAQASKKNRSLASMILRALENEGFFLVFQPIVSLKGDAQENYNASLRLRDQDRYPGEAKDFLDAAVRSGNMVAVDRWIIRHAIAAVAAHRAQRRRLNVFVDIAEATLQEDKLLIWICDCLSEFQARGNWITFQIRVDDARRHMKAFAKLEEGLRKVKCHLALKHFDIRVNAEILTSVPRVDFIRLVREHSLGVADDESKQRRLLDVTKLAIEAGTRSIVTGVEDARTLTALWTVGVDYVQGDFLQKPAPFIDAMA